MDDRAVLRAIAALERQYRHQLETAPHWLGISVSIGWVPIVRALLARVDREFAPLERRRIRWAQIKQKWGELRAYYHLDGELARLHLDLLTPDGEHVHVVQDEEEPLAAKLDRIIAEAAKEASKTCEICTAPGERVNNGGWIMVACPAHRERMEEEPW
jgi:hypothetical protein